jgi:hypothetical protein
LKDERIYSFKKGKGLARLGSIFPALVLKLAFVGHPRKNFENEAEYVVETCD